MRSRRNRVFQFLSCISALTLSACTPPGASGPVTGAAGGSTSIGANGVTRCPETLGTLAVDDGREQSWYGPFVSATHITTIEPMVRLIVQQSNCFTMTTIGNRRLNQRLSEITGEQRSGEFRRGSNQQAGQRMAADYFLELAVIFGNENTGGLGAGLGGLIPGRYGGVLGGLVGGGMSQSSTSVTMSLLDVRSQSQLAESEGNSSASSFGGLMGGFGGSGAGVLGGYSRTPAGQATVAAFVDAYNKLVVAMIDYRAQNIRGGAGTGGRLRPQGR